MTGWILDTNVLSELRRPRAEPKVVRFVSSQSLDLFHISVVTLAEIRFGIAEAAAENLLADPTMVSDTRLAACH